MEIINDNSTPNNDQHTPPSNGGVGPLGKTIILCAKIFLGIVLACWFIAALGILIGFVVLMAVEAEWSQMVAMNGMSPVVFAGLMCAVIVLGMGIVGDIGVSVLRGKRINLKRLGGGVVVWIIFFLWLIFAAVRNVDNWTEWAIQSEEKIELWEEKFEERFERHFESLEENFERMEKTFEQMENELESL